jgi:hypothetical protein
MTDMLAAHGSPHNVRATCVRGTTSGGAAHRWIAALLSNALEFARGSTILLSGSITMHL